jgi:glycosyltransferase involved in cell wall biosynthesis
LLKKATTVTFGQTEPHPMERKQVLLICGALPQMGRAGHLSYLYAILEYLDSRNFDITLLVVGYRFPRLIFRLSDYVPFCNVKLAGRVLLRCGDWVLVTRFGAWRRAAYRYLIDSRHKVIRKWVDDLRRRYVGEADVVMGQFASATDVEAERRWIENTNAKFVIIETIFLSPFQSCLPSGACSVIITHDVFHQRFLSFADRNIRAEPVITAASERDALKDYDHLIAISDADADSFASMLPNANIVVFSSVADLAEEGRRGEQVRGKRILFIGSIAHHNVDGLLWFLNEVWPRVRRQHPSATIDLVGSVCEGISDGHPGVQKHHIVKDIETIARHAAFAINPVQAGSGLKIKMLDYLSHGLPIVTSPVGVGGFPRNDSEPFLVCGDTASYYEAVDLLLRDPSAIRALSERCAAYARQFSRDVQFKKLDSIFG